MRKIFYPKLAAGNIRKNASIYFPYLLTCVITIAMYCIIRSLSLNPGIQEMLGGGFLSEIMYLGSRVVAVFAVIFLFYTNSFLVKRRKKEFGLFNVLGMEKRHLSRMLGWECIYMTLVSLLFGLGIGIALDKVMYLVVGKVIAQTVALGFFISGKAIGETAVLFGLIFLFICLYSVREVYRADPIELLRAGNAGEREPKTKWIMALAGVAALGGGYYIAITVRNPIASILLCFVAVILVVN